MKIYADENIEAAIIEGLRRRKINVVAAAELGYRTSVLTDRDLTNHIEFL